jgi:hypothetical protein
MTSESSTVEFHGHNGHLILGLSVLNSPIENDQFQVSSSATDQGGENLTSVVRNHRKKLTNSHHHNSQQQQQQQVCGISPEESTFFSVGEDNNVICWDEYDRTERFSFRLKESSEVRRVPSLSLSIDSLPPTMMSIKVVVMKTIWSLHYIATGHEDGIFSLWNIDSANRSPPPHTPPFLPHQIFSRVSSRSLRGNPITDIAEGKNKHNDDILIASDRIGRIAVWNLSLFRIHCLDLPLEFLCRGFHHPEDPGDGMNFFPPLPPHR